jgi:hypothetical protein
MTTDGKHLEHLVHLIEKSISPDATVEHDVDMPILSSRIGATTQCDIVIKSGTPPRQTITLVEVQDRRSRVKPNDFRGWKQKLEDVGAQHLICVSKQEFPESIKEQASLSGSAIMLITLREATPETLPLNFISLCYQFRHFDLKAITRIQPSISRSEAISLGIREAIHSKISLEANDRCWSVDGQHLVSLFTLCRDFYSPPEGESSGTGRIEFDLKGDPPLYHFVNAVLIRAGLKCEFEWTNEITEKPISILTYEQDEYGALAWVAEVSHDSPKGKVVIRMPLIKSGENYIVRSFYTEMPEDVDFSFGVLKSTN